MTFELGRALLLADAVAPDAMASALEMVATRGVPLPRALVSIGAIDQARLEEELARARAPVMRHVVPLTALVERLPAGICQRLLAVPVREDAGTQTVDVAVVDARDPHAAAEMAYWLGAQVRVVRTSYATMEAALARLGGAGDRGVRALAAPIWVPSAKVVRNVAETPLYGTHAVSVEPEPQNIPIPLSRRSLAPVAIVEIDGSSVVASPREPAIEAAPESDVVVDLRTRKSPLPRATMASEPPGPASRTPITARGPFAPNAPGAPFADVGAVVMAMRAATTRDAVLELLLVGARTVARKIALFVVKKNELVGWTCTPELGDKEAIRAVRVRLDAPTLLARALSGGTHLGKLLKNEAHAPILAAMRAPPGEVAVTGIRVEGRPALVLLADELGDTLIATRRFDELARVAGQALASIVRHKPRG